jgi:hypothetical protein
MYSRQQIERIKNNCKKQKVNEINDYIEEVEGSFYFVDDITNVLSLLEFEITGFNDFNEEEIYE